MGNKMFNFNDDEIKNLSQEEQIKLKTFFSNFSKEARSTLTKEICYLCGNKAKLINSHTIPKFILKNIAINGEVLTYGAIIENINSPDKKGINKTSTFVIICDKCDSSLFSEYEDEKNYKNIPSQKMLAQISLKTYLQEIDKKLLEIPMYEKMFNLVKLKGYEDHISHRIELSTLDFHFFKREFKYAKKCLDSNVNGYDLGYYLKVDYVIPLSFQSRVVLVSDFKNQTITNIYNLSPSYRGSCLNIALFPFQDYSIIMVFSKIGDKKKYKSFYKGLNLLPLEEQLKAIAYIIFAYSEEIYFNKDLLSKIPNFNELKQISGQTFFTGAKTSNDRLNLAKKDFNLSNAKKIPNFLSKEYSI